MTNLAVVYEFQIFVTFHYFHYHISNDTLVF